MTQKQPDPVARESILAKDTQQQLRKILGALTHPVPIFLVTEKGKNENSILLVGQRGPVVSDQSQKVLSRLDSPRDVMAGAAMSIFEDLMNPYWKPTQPATIQPWP